MPHLDFKYCISSVLWILLCFSVILLFSYYYTIPKINQIIQLRKTKINNNIATLQELNDEIQFLQHTYNSKIINAKKEFQNTANIELANFSYDIQNRLNKISSENKKKISKYSKLAESTLDKILSEHKQSLIITIKDKIRSSLKK